MTTSIGSRSYTVEEYDRVVAHLKDHHWGRKNPTTEPDLAHALGIGSRTVRAVMTEADGVDFVLAGGDTQGGTFLAEYQEEADRKTRSLLSRARKLRERADRRQHYSYRLPQRQGGLWDGDDDEEGEE